MRIIIFFIVLGLFISGCKKNQEIIINDSIYYKDIDPDTLITATLRYEPDAYHFCNETPVPSNGVAKYFLDLNNDDVYDFEFDVKRWTYIGYGSSFQLEPCLRFENFKTSVFSLNEKNKVCVRRGTGYAKEFLADDIISNDLTWIDCNLALYTHSVEYHYYSFPNLMEFYLGLQVYKDNRYYVGWVLINVSEDRLVIKEHGINLSENLKIKAGQKE